MDEELAARVGALEDRDAISRLIIQYAEAVDRRDADLLITCFTDDAEASFGGIGVPGRGGKAVAAFLGSVAGTPQQTGIPMKTSHLFNNVVITLDGDEADVRSTASVYSVRGEPEQVHIRGITYHDRVRRTADGWRIARRVHVPHWEGVAENVPLTPIVPADAPVP